MSIGVLFYGQWRTADYCLPWLELMLGRVNDLRFISVSTKAVSNYRNLKAGQEDSHYKPPADIKDRLRGFLPDVDRVIDINLSVSQQLNPSRGHWAFSRLFWSLNKALSGYNVWAETHGDVDLLVCLRLDTLIGPSIAALGDWLNDVQTDNFSVYTAPESLRFHEGELGLGIGDIVFAASPYAMNAMLSYTCRCLMQKQQSWLRFNHGPNILLKDAADAASIRSRALPVSIAIVRPNADLTIPVLESFAHHKDFWWQNHKAVK